MDLHSLFYRIIDRERPPGPSVLLLQVLVERDCEMVSIWLQYVECHWLAYGCAEMTRMS